MTKAWIAAWSLCEGHWPLPFVSARLHLAVNFASHSLKSSVQLPFFTALACTFNRQEWYRPVVLSSRDSHWLDPPPATRADGALTRGLAWVLGQVGSEPPASAAATPSVHWMMKAWIAAWSLLEGH
jgi:hypothetical protein